MEENKNVDKERMEQFRKQWEEIVKTHPLNLSQPIYPPAYHKAKKLLKEIERQREIRDTFRKLINLILGE